MVGMRDKSRRHSLLSAITGLALILFVIGALPGPSAAASYGVSEDAECGGAAFTFPYEWGWVSESDCVVTGMTSDATVEYSWHYGHSEGETCVQGRAIGPNGYEWRDLGCFIDGSVSVPWGANTGTPALRGITYSVWGGTAVIWSHGDAA
jgi:hypothetical protein